MNTKTGGCHCKAVRYEVDIDLSQAVIECNCSYCEMRGLLLSFVPAESIKILTGEDELTEYRFNTEKIAHLFCKTCGVQPFGRAMREDGNVGYAINVRTIDAVNLAEVTRMPFDGRSK
jgi:hypothetical protein